MTQAVIQLSPEQRQAIRAHIEGFKQYVQGQDAKEYLDEVATRTKLFKQLLSPEHLPQLTEEEFSQVMMRLWALNFWRNKDYKIKQVLQDNGISRMRESLTDLLHGTGSIDTRYDRFRDNVKGLGPAMITEILATMFPDRYCIWNDKPRNVLPYLKMGNLIPKSVARGQLEGSDYVHCIEVMKLVKDELKQNGVLAVGPELTPGFLTVDLFMWYIWQTKEEEIKAQQEKVPSGIEEVAPAGREIGSHEEAESILLQLGTLLGYDSYTADAGKKIEVEMETEVEPGKYVSDKVNMSLGEIASLEKPPPFAPERVMESVKEIDVIWFQEEFPVACFEVEHSTNVKDGLLRQYQISKHVPNAKFFIVGPEWQAPKFQKEVNTYPFNQIRDRYKFNSYKELIEFLGEAYRYKEKRAKFGL